MTSRFDRRREHFTNLFRRHLTEQTPEERLHLEGPGTNSLAAWFLGPRAENHELFAALVRQAVDANADDRITLYSDDPPYITAARKGPSYDASVQRMRDEYQKLLDQLRGSVPFFSYRCQAHMNWDLTMPGMLGYFAAMLYNQNNVALEASPITSQLEQVVGDDLCQMLGFELLDTSEPRPWGHITCDGSIANLEAMWAARNLKYYALSVKEAVSREPILEAARDMEVTLCDGSSARLLDLDAWALMNLTVDVVLALPEQIQDICGISSNEFSSALENYLLQSMGIEEFSRQYAKGVPAPVVLGPATKHYSWPKNAALTGIGKDRFIDIPVNDHARMDMESLEERLDRCSSERAPIVMVVVVLGSTEESAVDPLARVLELRRTYRRRGLDFVVHIDAAWGGYFASILREGEDSTSSHVEESGVEESGVQMTPALEMSPYVTDQYRALPGADSVTVDPHKAGYVPYPAGALCYRNGAMRNLVAFLAPEVYHGSDPDSNMGVFGVEGSKPGAAAAGVYLSHRIIRPDKSGYGKLLGQALFNSKRFFAAVVTMAADEDDFIVVPLQKIPAERQGGKPEEIAAQLRVIKSSIVDRQNNELIADPDAMNLLEQLGSDQIIITYGLNFKRAGALNTSPEKANDFMHEVFGKLSLHPDPTQIPELIITTSEFDPAQYGESFVRTYMTRLGLESETLITMNFISSTTMCPWLTATADGDFIPTLIRAFRAAIAEVLALPAYQ